MPARSLSLRSRRARGVSGLIAIALTCSLMLIAPRGASAQRHAASFVDSGTVTFVTDQTPSDIDPANDEVAGSDVIARSVAEPLVAPDGSSMSRFKPVLATSWKTNANQSVWTFYLRRGVRFHTGRCCMTADDVKYSLARSMLAGLVNSFGLARFMTNPMKQIKIINPYTVEFDLGRPQPLFVDQLSSLYMSLILDSKALKAHATKSDPWAHMWATDHDAGTGPYTIQSWVHSQQVVLTRFPDYWGGWSGPHFSKVIVRTVPEPPTRRELVERGQADLTFDLTPQDDLALSHNPAVKVIAPYGTEVDYIYMDEWGPLASTAARQALSYAMNYDAVIKGVFKGYARRAYGCLPSTMLGYDPNQFHYQTNLSKARELLQKAGVKPGTTLTYMTYNSIGNEIGLILQAQLAQLGITLKMQLVTEATLSSTLYGSEPASKRPNLMSWGWWPDFNDPYDECNILLNSAAAGANGANAGFYHNKQVDAFLNQMKSAGGEELISLAHRMQETAALDPSAIWTDEPAQVTVMGKNLQGYVFNPVELQTYDFYHMYRS
jgi:peptide/nickel transport system substrate-binding protein